MKHSLKVVLGLLVSVVCLWLVLRNVQFSKVLITIRHADPIWFGIGLCTLILSMTMRSIRWTIILSSLKPLSVFTVAPHLLFGFFMNNVLPARAGEAARAVSLSRQQDLSFGSVFGTVFLERFFDLTGFFFIVLLSSALLPWKLLPIPKLIAVIIIGFVGLIFVVINRQRLSAFAAQRGGLLGKIVSFISDATSSFVTLKSFKKIFSVLLLSLLVWTNEALQIFIIAHAIHLPLTFLESAAVLTGFSVGVMFPAAPGFVGTYEFFGNQMLMFLGKDPVVSISFVFALHAYQLVMMGIFGVCSMLFVSKPDTKVSAG